MFIIGRKLGMTQIFRDDGEVIPVTVIEAGPCFITQIKTVETDGYNAIQIGFEDISESKVSKSMRGHFARANVAPKRYIREFRVDNGEYEIGQEINASVFEAGDEVEVIGVSKGRGFAGGVKRFGWKGGRASHGSRFHRRVGSIGASADPGKVFKGKTMPGHMGNETVCQRGLEIVEVDEENNLLLVKGSIPGHNKSIVYVKKG
jgi:large subunit ribosomal protein L3